MVKILKAIKKYYNMLTNNEENANLEFARQILKILEKNGVTPYHLCYEINCSIEDAVKEMKGDRFLVIAKPTYSDNLKGRVCFLFHKDVGIVELLEYEKV